MYGQYPYARNSKLIKFLLRLFPKPDFVFFLNVSPEVLLRRRPDQTIQNLYEQNENYSELKTIFGDWNLIHEIKENWDVDAKVDKIVDTIWKRRFEKLRY